MSHIVLHILISLFIIGYVSCDDNDDGIRLWDSANLNLKTPSVQPFKRRQIFRYGKRNSYPTAYSGYEDYPYLRRMYRK
uniref:Uncharacterized protein n=1 Tax=Trichobilharzia regenti TaxID=157069 RepID=A0AA85KJ50_TRIRE|nr:unnamed protein product [Trichobilharzia regenti]